MKKTLYQYAVLVHFELGKGKYDTQMIVEPSFVLATSQDEVKLIVGKKLPEEYLNKLDQLEVIVRPF